MRRDLFEQFQPFRTDTVFEIDETGAMPPGRAKLLTKPAPTGSATLYEHDWHGARRLATTRHGLPPEARMTSGASATNSAACFEALRVAYRPAIVDAHVATDLPAPLPAPAGRLHSGPGLRFVSAEIHEHADRRIRSGCCARAASGHAAAAPPSSVMNSRRFITRLTRRRARGASGGTVRPSALSGLEIDDQFVLGRLHDRQVAASHP